VGFPWLFRGPLWLSPTAGTRGRGLHYARKEKDCALKLTGYSDADMAGDIDT
jgi:hypothetical protein